MGMKNGSKWNCLWGQFVPVPANIRSDKLHEPEEDKSE